MSFKKSSRSGDRTIVEKQPSIEMLSTNSPSVDIFHGNQMNEKLSEALTSTITKELLDKKQVEHISDDRRLHVISRSKSRFSTGVVPNEVYSIEFHPTGSMLAYSRYDSSLTVWFLNHDSFERSEKLYKAEAMGEGKTIYAISWNSNEVGQFATVAHTHYVQIWNVDNITNSLTQYKRLTIENSDIKVKFTGCHFDPTGKWLVAKTKSDELYLYDVKSNYTLVKSFKLESDSSDSITSLCWNNNGNYIVVGTNAGKLTLLNISDEGEIEKSFSMPAHRGKIVNLKVDFSGELLISAGIDGACIIWELSSLTCRRTIVESESDIRTLDISPSGKLLVIATEAGVVRFYDIMSGNKIEDYDRKNYDSDFVVKFYPNKSWLILSGDNDTLCRLFTEKSHNDELDLWKSSHPEISSKSSPAKAKGNTRVNRENDWSRDRHPTDSRASRGSRNPRDLRQLRESRDSRDSSRGPDRNKRIRSNPRPSRFNKK